jgi:hypothetical protein
VPVALRLLGTAFLPLLAAALTMAFQRLVLVGLQVGVRPGLMHGAVVGSLVLVGALSYRWTGRASVAVGMVLASICVTMLFAFALLLWALGSAFE